MLLTSAAAAVLPVCLSVCLSACLSVYVLADGDCGDHGPHRPGAPQLPALKRSLGIRVKTGEPAKPDPKGSCKQTAPQFWHLRCSSRTGSCSQVLK